MSPNCFGKMSRQPSSLKLKDPGKRVFSTSASQIQNFFRERADTFEHERKRAGYILLSQGVPVLVLEYEYCTQYSYCSVDGVMAFPV